MNFTTKNYNVHIKRFLDYESYLSVQWYSAYLETNDFISLQIFSERRKRTQMKKSNSTLRPVPAKFLLKPIQQVFLLWSGAGSFDP